jgi:hypothetical protein
MIRHRPHLRAIAQKFRRTTQSAQLRGIEKEVTGGSRDSIARRLPGAPCRCILSGQFFLNIPLAFGTHCSDE